MRSDEGRRRLPAPPEARGENCPGLLALHPARDGSVARIRLPGGYVTGARWRALAGLADDLGDGHLDLTSRGNVQLRGIRDADAAELASRAAAAGLLPSVAHDRARNIMASPLAGLGGRPPLRQLVRRLDAVLLADSGLATLPGRFLFSLDDGTGGSGLAGCDIGLRRYGRGAEIIVAGRRTGVLIRLRQAVPAMSAAARAAMAAGVGSTVTRIADLADGGQSVAAAAGGSLGAPAGEPDARLALGIAARDQPLSGGQPRELITVVTAARLARLTTHQMRLTATWLGPHEVIRLGIAGRLVLPLALPPPSEQPASGPRAGDRPAIPAIPAGRATGGQPASGRRAGELAGFPAEPDFPASATRPAEAGLEGVLAELAGAGLIVSGDDLLAGVTACSGAACSRSLADVRAAAGPVPGHDRTHWAGCARTCGLPPDAEPVIATDVGHYLIPGAAEPVACEMLVAP